MADLSVWQKNKEETDPSLRTYQLAERQYQTARTASNTLTGVGAVLLYVSVYQIILVFNGTLFLLHVAVCLVSGAGGIAVLSVSRQMRRLSQMFKTSAEEQRQLADDLLTWFLTTYSCDQIDSQIDAITHIGDTLDLSYLQRMDMIRILFTREYDESFDELFLTQLCEDVYQMLYGAKSSSANR